MLPARVQIGEARVCDEVLPFEDAAEVGPVPVGFEEHELDMAAVLRAVGADEGVHVRTDRHRAGSLALECGQHVR